MATRDGTGWGAGKHDRYVFCYCISSYSPLFFFSLLLPLLSQTTATDWAGSSGAGQDGATIAMRNGTGGQAGGRRRWEKVGRQTGGEHGDS